MGSEILRHMADIQAIVVGLPALQAFTFGAACAERAWPVYRQASQGQEWERRAILRGALDAVWSWLAGGTERPELLAAQCEQAVVDKALPDAYVVANNLFGLLSFIEQDDPSHCHLCAEMNLDLITSYLYDFYHLKYSEESEAAVDAHELTRQEMHCQTDDLRRMSQFFSVQVVVELRNRSLGKSIFGSL
jgi:hypothetical protein